MGLLGDLAWGLAGALLEAAGGDGAGNSSSNENDESYETSVFYISDKEVFKNLLLGCNEIFLEVLRVADEDICYDFSSSGDGKPNTIGFTVKANPPIRLESSEYAYDVSANLLILFGDYKISINDYLDCDIPIMIGDGYRSRFYVLNATNDTGSTCRARYEWKTIPLEDVIQELFESTEIYENLIKFLNKLKTIRDKALDERYNFLFQSFHLNERKSFVCYLNCLNYIFSNRTIEISDMDLYKKFIAKWDDIFQRKELFDNISYSDKDDKRYDYYDDEDELGHSFYSDEMDIYSKENIKIKHWHKLDTVFGDSWARIADSVGYDGGDAILHYEHHRIIYANEENSTSIGCDLIREIGSVKSYNDERGIIIFKLHLWLLQGKNQKSVTTLEIRSGSALQKWSPRDSSEHVSYEFFFCLIGQMEMGKHFRNFITNMQTVKTKEQDEKEKKKRTDALSALDDI